MATLDRLGNLPDRHTARRQLGLPEDAPIVGAIGRVSPSKNHALICHAAAVLRDELPALQVVGAETNRLIVDADNDLGDLMNLWSGRQLAGPQIHPVLEIRPGTHAPDLLVIGDSFVFTLTNLMDREQLYRKRDTYYYYNRQYFYPEAPNVALDKRQLDLLEAIAGRDAIVVEVSEYWLPRIGFGFVRDLLKAYDALDAARAGAPAP